MNRIGGSGLAPGKPPHRRQPEPREDGPETRLEEHDFYGVHNFLPNQTLATAAMEVLEALGPLEFTAEEEAFAREVSDAFGEAARIRALEHAGLPKEMKDRVLLAEPVQPTDEGKTMSGSTDVSEASFTFAGTGVAIVGRSSQMGGRADVYLDGKKVEGIDAWIPERTHDNDLWHVTGLEPGRHTVRVVARGDADPRSKGTEVRIDWAIVYGAQAAP